MKLKTKEKIAGFSATGLVLGAVWLGFMYLNLAPTFVIILALGVMAGALLITAENLRMERFGRKS